MPDGKPDFTKNLVSDALGLLLERYKGKPVMAALVKSYVSELEEVRNALLEVVLARDARTAYGIYLDVIGKIVGQARNAANDEAYRLLINTKIAINKSSGRAKDLEVIWELLGNDPNDLRLDETFPAAGVITSVSPLLPAALLSNIEMIDVLTRVFKRGNVNDAGVRLTFVYATDVNDFEYKNVGGTDVTAHSYSDIVSGANLYGKWASVT